ELWKKYKPTLVIHVGVSSEARKITIESRAFRNGYYKTDCVGKQHRTNEVCSAVEGAVSSEARKITIESRAFRNGYYKTDCVGKQHQTNEVCSAVEGADCIKAGLDVDEICNFLNANTDIKACLSKNAGRYLCEYIFYKSLLIDSRRTLFVHRTPFK
ncbi:hypothetical protein AMK59_8320, partial [Oryctes borbonicus]